jgi:hypothetical protein
LTALVKPGSHHFTSTSFSKEDHLQTPTAEQHHDGGLVESERGTGGWTDRRWKGWRGRKVEAEDLGGSWVNRASGDQMSRKSYVLKKGQGEDYCLCPEVISSKIQKQGSF